jgi:hypothetical protein
MGAKEIQKKSKNGKPVHGVMICEVIPRKNMKDGIPIFHGKTLHNKMPPRRTSLGFLPN